MQIGRLGSMSAALSTSVSARPTVAAIPPEHALASESSAELEVKSAAFAAGDKAGAGAALTPQQERLQNLTIAELASRDREVRAHEQAHAAVGGSYAGAPAYTFKRGPDGQTYATGGEVSIDVSAITNDPAATLRKMEQVERAALAPAEPSAQDRRVAAQAQVIATQARAELAAQQRAETASAAAERRAEEDERQQDEAPAESDQQSPALAPNLQLYRRLSQLQEPSSLVDVIT